MRTALRSGLRREGLLRGNTSLSGERHDTLVLGRVREDPEPDTREGFIGILNSTSPTKRSIAQGVLWNARGDVLLCELTYKAEWDLPGGVVDPSESPAACLVARSARSPVRRHAAGSARRQLAAAVGGWTDATVFVFDLGRAPDDLAAGTPPSNLGRSGPCTGVARRSWRSAWRPTTSGCWLSSPRTPAPRHTSRTASRHCEPTP